MAKVYEYILRLQDQASTALNKVGAATDSTQRKTDALTGSVSRLNGLLGVVGVSFGAIGAYQAAKGIVTMASDLEQTSVAFEVMTGSAQKAKTLIDDIRNMAAVTPFQTGDLISSAQLLMNFGIAQEKVIPIMKALGDVSSGNKERFERLSLAYAQVQSAGKLAGQDLLQFVNAGFNPLQIISEKTGKSMAQLRKDMEKGSITAAMVTKAFADVTGEGGKFHNMMDRQSQTIAGKWSTLVDVVKIKATSVGTSVNSFLVKLIDVGLWFSEHENIAAAFATGIGVLTFAISYNTIAMKVQAGWASILAVKTAIWTGAQWLLNAAFWANPITWVVAGIIALVAVIVLAYQKVGWFRGAIYASWEAIKGFGLLIKDFVVDRIKGILTGLGGLGKALMQFFAGDWKNAWQTAKTASADLLGVNALSNAVSNAKELGSKIGSAYHKGVAEVDEKKRKAGIADKGIAGAALPGLSLTDIANKDAKASANQSTKAVASGGTRNTSIVIHLGKLVETISFAGGMKENAQDLTQQVEEALMRVLYAAESAS